MAGARASHRPDTCYRHSAVAGRSPSAAHARWASSSIRAHRARTTTGNTERPSAGLRSTGGLRHKPRSRRPSPRGGGPRPPHDPRTIAEVPPTLGSLTSPIRWVNVNLLDSPVILCNGKWQHRKQLQFKFFKSILFLKFSYYPVQAQNLQPF